MAIQSQGSQVKNQNTNVNVPRLNSKTNLTCYKCGDKTHLARKCPHTGNAAVSQPQSTQSPTVSQADMTGTSLLLAANPTLSEIIDSKTCTEADSDGSTK